MRKFKTKEKEVEGILNMYPGTADLRQAIQKQRELCFHARNNATRFEIDMNLGKEKKNAVNSERLDKLMQQTIFCTQMLTYMLCALYGPDW